MNYWQKRQQQLNKQLEKDEEKLKKRLSSYFDAEYRKLDKQIAAYYKQYGTDNVIQYRRLMESLPEDDKRLLMEQMDEFAKKYPEYASLMPVRESIYKLNRLEGLQYSVRMQQLEIGAVENEQITAHLNRNVERGVNAAAESMGFGKNFYANNPDISKLFVNVPWSNGENFSQKIWNNTTKLANYLNSDIAQGIARGDSYERLTRRLRERFSNVSRNDAYRLIYTEGTYVMAEATMQPFTEDFEKYRLSTVGDGKVCGICRGVSREVFNISDRQPGVNFPPLHPWCRCTFTIEVDDWDKWMEDYEKRHGNGQAQKVTDRLGYENHSKKSIAKDSGSGIIDSGAISGALTDKNDPLGEKRRRHADTYYESIRNSKKDSFVKTISKNSGLSEAYISKVYNHVFVNEYELYGGKKRFAPDYDMAESFRRLRYGKDIQKHDIVLLKHEHLEYGLMNKLHFQYDEAYALAEQKYDYATALKEFKKKNNL